MSIDNTQLMIISVCTVCRFTWCTSIQQCYFLGYSKMRNCGMRHI